MGVAYQGNAPRLRPSLSGFDLRGPPPEEIEALYMLQSDNVRHLADVLASLNREINRLIARSDEHQIQMRTKILALVYSAWSEAQFLQILYTPRGLRYTEIEAIKVEKNENGIGAGWRLLLDKSMSRVGDAQLNKDLRARLTKLETMTKIYIEDPSIIRNKIAHGQWIHALNRRNTAKNEAMTLGISNLDPVEIMKNRKIHQYFGYIVRDLMQSPTKGFHRHYWTNIVNLEQFISKSRNWTLNSKKVKIDDAVKRRRNKMKECKCLCHDPMKS